MPATKNAMTRYKFLDELLSNRYHRYSMEELTEEVNKKLSYIDGISVGVRCIQKDLKYLQSDPFYAPIISKKVDAYDHRTDKPVSKLCWFYEDPTFSIFAKKMSDDERYLLGETLNLIGQFEGLPNFEALQSLRESLKLEGPDHRQIVNFGHNPAGESNLFGRLFTAISQKQVIELHYCTAKEPDADKIVNLHPYLLKEYNCCWYLLASAESDGKLLNFPLFNIHDFVPLPAHTYVEPSSELDEWFDDIIGVSLYPENPLEHIAFWVSDWAKSIIEHNPIHLSQTPIRGEKTSLFEKLNLPRTGGGFFFIECRVNYELIRELYSYGDDLVILDEQSIDGKPLTTTISSTIKNRCQSVIDDYNRE